jgi:hypothetical protein
MEGLDMRYISSSAKGIRPRLPPYPVAGLNAIYYSHSLIQFVLLLVVLTVNHGI